MANLWFNAIKLKKKCKPTVQFNLIPIKIQNRISFVICFPFEQYFALRPFVSIQKIKSAISQNACLYFCLDFSLIRLAFNRQRGLRFVVFFLLRKKSHFIFTLIEWDGFVVCCPNYGRFEWRNRLDVMNAILSMFMNNNNNHHHSSNNKKSVCFMIWKSKEGKSSERR